MCFTARTINQITMTEQEIKHTQGPWYPIEYAGVFNINDEPFYEGQNLFDRDYFEEAELNARLAASSPELLNACREAVSTIEMLMGDKLDVSASMSLASIQKAIRKATTIS